MTSGCLTPSALDSFILTLIFCSSGGQVLCWIAATLKRKYDWWLPKNMWINVNKWRSRTQCLEQESWTCLTYKFVSFSYPLNIQETLGKKVQTQSYLENFLKNHTFLTGNSYHRFWEKAAYNHFCVTFHKMV